jgi:hypothetical protein
VNPKDYVGIQTWLIAFFTIALYTTAFKENPVYRFVEHLYVGLYAGYMVVINWFNYGRPTITTYIMKNGQWEFVIPILVGLLIYTRYFKSVAWMSRYTMSFVLGYGAGYILKTDFKSLFLTQMVATFRPLWVAGNLQATFNNWVLVFGVLGVLSYFFFTSKRTGIIGVSNQIGKWIMMVAFGSAFGNTVMARVALFLGRLQFLMGDWLHLLSK